MFTQIFSSWIWGGKNPAIPPLLSFVLILIPPVSNLPQGIFLVYDITSERSFQHIMKWASDVDEVSYSQVAV